MRILVADDDPSYLALVQAAVEAQGHDVVVAKDGIDAWAAFDDEPTDVVISDLQMPGVDGLELVRRIRSTPAGAPTYVILVTGHGSRAEVLAGMEAGADDYLTKPLDLDELTARLIAAARVTSLHKALAANRVKLEALNAELQATARRDALTGVGNRLALQEDVVRVRSGIERRGMSATLVLVDVDHFKAYNDAYGHLAGDLVLRAVADAMRTGAREEDAFYRYGGEEFIGIFPDSGAAAAERLRGAVESLGIEHTGNPAGVVTVSAGVTWLRPGDLRPIEDILREADEALYRAKAAGRNRVETSH